MFFLIRETSSSFLKYLLVVLLQKKNNKTKKTFTFSRFRSWLMTFQLVQMCTHLYLNFVIGKRRLFK